MERGTETKRIQEFVSFEIIENIGYANISIHRRKRDFWETISKGQSFISGVEKKCGVNEK